MAGTIIAYSEITILDLIDTATYIYYSANEDGSGATNAPDANTKYIGIYSGPPLEGGQPTIPPDDTIWSKYVGEKGETGNGIDYIEYKYQTHSSGTETPAGEWLSEIPAVAPGTYLWTQIITYYTDGTLEESYSVSYSGTNGEDANYYEVEFSTEEIVQFLSDSGISYSPNYFSFEVYDTRNNGKKAVDLTEWELSLTFCYGVNFTDEPTDEQMADSIFDTNDLKGSNYRQITIENIFKDWDDYHGSPLGYEGVLKITFSPPGESSFVKILNFRNGVSSDLASFNINAAGFNSAVAGGKLSFSANGLEIFQKGITIYKGSDRTSPVFQADDDGDLKITGEIYATGGVFNGTIHAADGEFSGIINAASGTIGGFTIDEDSLYSGDNKEDSSLVLYGKEGKIKADNIELGIGAVISQYIQLGDNAFILNPNIDRDNDGEPDHIILESGAIKLKDDGTLRIGSMIIDGNNGGSIKNNLTDSRWEINGDGSAIFNDIYADNVHLANTILEVGTVQSVGSLMLFKDSWAISEIVDEDTFTIDQQTTLKQGDWIYTGEAVHKIASINYNEEADITTIDLEDAHSLNSQSIISKFGEAGKDYVFSILGGYQKNESNLWSFAKNNSLTIADFSEAEGEDKLNYTTRLLLGDLSAIPNGEGMGLYADNVILKGSLTTQTKGMDGQDGTYAGINTTSGATALSNYHGEDSSKIVFWAGAGLNSEDKPDIENAPFQVTEKGSLYAQKGYFKGSIITDATIEASTLKAATIYGTDKVNDGPTLKIYDAYTNSLKGGIGFYSSNNSPDDETDDVEVLRVTGNGMSIFTKDENNTITPTNFINISDGKISYFGSSYTGELVQVKDTNGEILISSSGLTRKNDNEGSSTLQSSIILNDNINFTLDNNPYLTISKQMTTIGQLQEIDYSNKQITFKNGEVGNMTYKQVTNGYDLYIS